MAYWDSELQEMVEDGTPADDSEWMGKEIEDDTGKLKSSAIHAWEDGNALCGIREPRGAWVDGHDSNGSECKKCRAIVEKKILESAK